MDLIATVRREVKIGAGPQRDLRLTTLESLGVAQFEPLCYEASRAGRRFSLAATGALTGIAPVQAAPTTAAQWVLWNGESGGGKAYAVEEASAVLTSGTPGVGGILLGCLFTLPAVVTLATNAKIQSRSASGLGSKAVVASAVTITSASPAWFKLAENNSPNVGTFPGSGNISNVELRGSIVIPPQTGLALVVLAPTGTTPLFAPALTWCELEADLE